MKKEILSRLYEIIDVIESNFAQGNVEAVNEVLKRVSVDEDPILQLSYLRCSFRARHLLPEWQPCAERCYQKRVEMDGEVSANKTFWGLI